MPTIITRKNNTTHQHEQILLLNDKTTPADLSNLSNQIKIARCETRGIHPAVLAALPDDIVKIENYQGQTILLPRAFTHCYIGAHGCTYSKSVTTTAALMQMGINKHSSSSPVPSPQKSSPPKLVSIKNQLIDRRTFKNPYTKRKVDCQVTAGEEPAPKKARK